MKYWTFKHKPGKGASENDVVGTLQKALDLKCCLMHYEYGIHDTKSVTNNWRRARDIRPGHVVFLLGDNQRVYAYGNVIRPRQQADVTLSFETVTDAKKHGENNEFRSDKSPSSVIHFEDAEAFYENLEDGADGWGQRVDVDAWHQVVLDGVTVNNDYYKKQDNQLVIRELKPERARELKRELEDRFREENPGEIMVDEIMQLLKANMNVILTGAPGTGKTWLAKQVAKRMTEDSELGDRFEFVQFHPSYDYTDFVEGLRPLKKGETLGFERRDGIFKDFCDRARQHYENSSQKKPEDSKNAFVFIIDEINRAEISKVFGELFFSLDPGYRGEDGKVRTQYANLRESKGIEEDESLRNFYVPENAFIIGTMNDIDRSVESFDFAMRRRFAWKEIQPQDRVEMLDNLKNQEWMEEAKSRMERLNQTISEMVSLGSAFQIGPAYFLKLDLYDGDFDQLWKFHLERLLAEYLRGLPDAQSALQRLKASYDGNEADS